MSTEAIERPTIAPYLKVDDKGPYLSGVRCGSCGHVYVGERKACAKCAARDQMQPVRLAETGKVWVHTVVYRSFPGVPVPFIDVIVDLDDGSNLKGTLIGVEPDPQAIAADLPVKVVYREASPVNRPGETYLTYAFQPA